MFLCITYLKCKTKRDCFLKTLDDIHLKLKPIITIYIYIYLYIFVQTIFFLQFQVRTTVCAGN